MKVGYAGEPGAFGEQAAQALGADVESVSLTSFAEVARAVVEGEVPRGVIPVENSVAGAVAEGLAAVLERRPGVCGQILVQVRHLLVGLPGARLEDVREVTSHPQALAQCRRFVAAHGWRTVPEVNTAIAARRVREGGRSNLAAIASAAAAERLGLSVLASGIADSAENVTRFLVLVVRAGPAERPPHGAVRIFAAPAGQARAPARVIGRADAEELVEAPPGFVAPGGWALLGAIGP